MYVLKPTGQFEKDLKRSERRRKDMGKMRAVLAMLQEGQTLPVSCRDHALTGNWRGHRDCHIEPDWLLIYRVEGQQIILIRTGTHADIFG